MLENFHAKVGCESALSSNRAATRSAAALALNTATASGLSTSLGRYGKKAQLQPAALNNQRSPIRTKTAREQSSPNSEKSPRKLRDLIKRNAGFMAKASKCE